ncbi:integrase core domain-containing protein [Siphonobacter curvatus]|uniref:integrase core domain-containing protein n=1 Tax=Siphonobacter curvatus TaxID=2094562 RepID=UPI000D526419
MRASSLSKCFNTSIELELPIKESVEIYNNKRPHLSLNRLTPNDVHKKPSRISLRL